MGTIGAQNYGRVRLLARARFSQALPSGGWLPVAGILIHGGLLTVCTLILGGQVQEELFAGLTLALSGILCGVALLGDLAPILARDPAGDWIESQPSTPTDHARARTLVLTVVLGSLGAGGMVPVALLGPGGSTWLLPILGALQALAIAAGLLMVGRFAGRHGTGFFVGLQTLLLAMLFGGSFLVLEQLPHLTTITEIPAPWHWLPPFGLGALLGDSPNWIYAAPVLALAVALPFIPASESEVPHSTATPMARLLAPLARGIEKMFLAPSQRAPFRFIQQALPAERDFAIRAWPLGIAPLALLGIGADPSTLHGQGLFALVAFAPAAYLPVFLMFVPTTRTPAARWILDTSPLHPRDEAIAGRWAVALRVILPLQSVIGLALFTVLPGAQVLMWCLASLLTAGFVLGMSWNANVPFAPLSTDAVDLGGAFEGGSGTLLINALFVGAISLGVWHWNPSLVTITVALGIFLAASRRIAFRSIG